MPGWLFSHGDNRYWVKAPTVDEARKYVAKKSTDAAATEPQSLPQQALDFIGMKKDGDLATGRVFNSGSY